MVDAHSQFGCEIGASEIADIINRYGVDYTLLSARGCRGESPGASNWRVFKLVENLKGRAGFLISGKLGGMGREEEEFGSRGLSAFYAADNEYFEKSLGFAEILVQHAPHDTSLLKYSGLDFDLENDRIKKAVDVVIGRKVPVILHLELNDAEDQSGKLLNQLKILLAKHPDNDFVLIHMAQATVTEARALIEKFRNIHFLTTAADAFPVLGMKKLRQGGQSAQMGWINLFNDPPANAPYRGWLGDYLPTMKWRDEWKRLIEEHPDRFVFALENVFGPHWTKRYRLSVKLWRKAFSMLSNKTAQTVACGNAKRLWRLGIECRSE